LLLLVGVWSFFSSSSREVADGTAASASVPSTTTTVIKKGEVGLVERAEEKVQESSREQTPPSFPSSPRRVGVSVSHEAGLVDLRRGAVLLGEFEVNASQLQSQDEGGVHVHGDRRGGVQLEPPTLCEESDRGRDRESEGDSDSDSDSGSDSGCRSSDSVWDINGDDLLSDSSPGWSSDSDSNSSSLSSTSS
jgi:hypothetical protein